jgi:hypothetical protein
LIVVHLIEGETDEYDNATRFATDEHNNLCVFTGRNTDALLAVYHQSVWAKCEAADDDQG